MNSYVYNCELIRVIDGDTIVGLVDLGFSTWKKVHIRILHIDTPEVRTRDLKEKELGLMAKARVEELLENGKFILVSKEVDSFGRSLGVVYTVDHVSIGDKLLEEGLAKSYE